MMRWIVRSSLTFRLLVLSVAAGLMLFGLFRLPDASVDTLPEFTPPTVEIQTEALGLSAAEVEQLITVPLEADLLNGVAFLDDIRSESVPGLSSIELIFEPGTDILEARQVVAERMTQAHALPHVSKAPAMLQPLSSTSRVVMAGISSDDMSLIDMSVLAQWKIKPRLLGVKGVANVAIWGQRDRQLQVQVDPAKLRENGVTLTQVMKTSGNALWWSPLSFVEASTPGTGGFIDTPNQRLGVQHISPIKTADDLAAVTVEDTEGRRLRLGDVATVVEDHQPLIGDAVGGDSSGLMLVVEKFPGASTTQVTRDVEAALDAMKPGLPGVTVDTSIYRPASFVDSALANLGWVLLVGMLLVLALIAALLFHWRAALISLLAIPMAMMAALVVLDLRGANFNMMILAGLVLALGFVVDDAIVDVDNIRRRLRRHRDDGDDQSTARVVVDAVLETRSSALYGLLIALVAMIPVAFLGGLNGELARPVVLSYVLAVLASMAVALTVTPALGLMLLTGEPHRRRESPVVRALKRGYASVLQGFVRGPLLAGATVVVLALAGLAVVPALQRGQALPALQERDLLIQWDGAPGTSQPEMARITGQASRELRALPGVLDVGAHVGRAITSDQVVGISSSEIWVNIAESADYRSTTTAIRDVVEGYPGMFREVQTYPEQRLAEVHKGTDDDLVVRVFGQDLDVLHDEAAKVRNALAGIDGVVNPQLRETAEEPTVEVRVDLAKAEAQGIKPGDVRRAAATLVSGVHVGSLFEEQKVFDVMVWGTPEIRQSIGNIRDLLVDRPGGGHVRLGDVADVRVVPASTVIQRESVSRLADVTASVRGRSAGAVTDDVEAALEAMDFPVEYHAEVLGDQAQARADQERVWSLGIAAAIGVFLLLQAAFRSWRLAALVFATLPVALAGATVAAFLGIDTLSLAAMIGFVAVLGIAVRHTVAVVKHLQGLELEDEKASRPDLVLRGSTEQFTPTLITALATGLLMLPIVVFGGVAGLEVIRPAAIIVLGGIVTSTLYSMLVVPALYLRFAPTPQPTFDSFVPHQASERSRAGRETEMVTPRGDFDATR